MALVVHLLREVEEVPLAHLRARLHPDVVLTVGHKLMEPADYEVLVAGRPERAHIEASSDLRALIIPYAGLPPETRSLMLDFPDIAVHNLHHNAVAAAEMAVTLMLAAGKFVVPNDRALREHDWRPRYRRNPAIVLEGKTALILGHGAIGRRVARACRGLGMNVVATRRQPPPGSEELYPPDALPDLLPRANALIIALPLTAETEGLIGRDELAKLPPKSLLINVGRGPIVHEQALYSALVDGTLHAAGLDVWYNYPEDEASRSDTPPSAYPFHTLDNVVMSPHRAGSGRSEEIELQRMTHLARLLNVAATGEEMPDRVDVDAGY
jgi:phosphoglycerate dehydrogenase-like enzyme